MLIIQLQITAQWMKMIITWRWRLWRFIFIKIDQSQYINANFYPHLNYKRALKISLVWSRNRSRADFILSINISQAPEPFTRKIFYIKSVCHLYNYRIALLTEKLDFEREVKLVFPKYLLILKLLKKSLNNMAWNI